MPYSIHIHHNSESLKITIPETENLLDILQKHQINIAAPCGGHKTCGKCKLEILEANNDDANKREVLACGYSVISDIEVFIPQVNEAKIQSESYFPDLNLEYNKLENPEYGIAVDVGTTTVVVFLEDLQKHKNIDSASFLNPQKTYGADVISRIQYCMEEDGLKILQEILINDLNKSIQLLCQENNIDKTSISKVSLAGNTSMLHILKGVDPAPLASYPFDPVFVDLQIIPSTELRLNSSPEASVHFLPSLSAYVGADIMAGIAASEIPDDEEYSLFLDIGTNGEMALGNKNRILCCAAAAGPAFEGAKISCGLGGVDGAIHSFSDEGFETIGDSKAIGLCGSGLIDVVAWLLKNQKIDLSGFLENPVNFLTESDLSLTPQDIREVQLAKGAIAAGIETLIKMADIQIDQISKVYLAGGFGYAIHPESAAAIGLLPEALIHKIIRAGNTSGLGARLYLHADKFGDRISQIASSADHFDLSMDMGFNESFVMNMGFPDQSALQ